MKSIDDRIWMPLSEGASFARRASFGVMRLAYAVARDMQEGHLSMRATSLVYTTLLSLAPVLAVSFSVLKGIGAHGQIEPFLRSALSPFGNNAGEISEKIVGFVDNINVGVLGVVGVGLLFYGVISLMQKIEAAFNDIWRLGHGRSFISRVRDYLAILLIGPFCLFLAVGISASLQHAALAQKWFGIDIPHGAIENVFAVVPYVLFTLAFAFLYMVMPNTRVRFIPALCAGLVTGIFWKALGWIFGTFVVGSASYAAIYSVFASLVLFMIWVYLGWLVVLIGASISYYLQNPSDLPLSRSAGQMGVVLREKLALKIVADVGHALYHHESGLTVQQLAARTDVPASLVGDMVEDLKAAGILAQTAGASAVIVPAVPLDTTTVYDMLKALRMAGDTGILTSNRIRAGGRVESLLAAADRAAAEALGGVTLKELALGEGKKT